MSVPLHIPQSLLEDFSDAVDHNTSRLIETLGYLCGTKVDGRYEVNSLVIPQQTGKSDECEVTDEGALLLQRVVENSSLSVLGWIHVHPDPSWGVQPSSVDLHNHWLNQKCLPESVAVIVNPASMVYRDDRQHRMGNIESQCHPDLTTFQCDHANRIIETTDFLTWCDETHGKYGCPEPCVDYHNSKSIPYSYSRCFSLEVKVGRRRSVQFRRDLNRYTAELERITNGRHSIHIRDHVKGNVTIVPLIRVSNNLPELDYMYDPVLTVIAYHLDVIAISIQEKTKNIPKVMVFCDVGSGTEIGHYVAQLNYSNLNSVLIDCCISPDATRFVIYILEDHYDEFQAHFHAVEFEDCRAKVICEERFGQPTWYEPGLYMCFLPDRVDNTPQIVVLGECSPGLSYPDPCRHLVVYDLSKSSIVHGVEFQDSLFPVSLSCSPDGEWIATMSRDPTQHQTGLESYVIKFYSSDDLQLRMKVTVPLTPDSFNALSHCNQVVFSQNSQLVAVAYNEQPDANFCWEFGSYVAPTGGQDFDSVHMTVYRLPVAKLRLKALCRDAILNYCPYNQVNQLPLPSPLQKYVLFKEKWET